MLQVGIVSVHYYPEYVTRSLRALEHIARELDAKCMVVANRPDILSALRSQCATKGYVSHILEHDNRGLEFGAYQHGLQSLRSSANPDWVVFVNDTLAIHHCFPRAYRHNLLNAVRNQQLSTLPIIVGKVESLDRSFELERLRAFRWVTSSLVAMNRRALDTLHQRIYLSSLERLVKPASALDDFFSSELDPITIDHLSRWLFGLGPPPHWYGAEPLTRGNAHRLARKAQCILQEQFLSARLDNAGALFVDLKKLTLIQKLTRWIEERLFMLLRRGTHTATAAPSRP